MRELVQARHGSRAVAVLALAGGVLASSGFVAGGGAAAEAVVCPKGAGPGRVPPGSDQDPRIGDHERAGRIGPGSGEVSRRPATRNTPLTAWLTQAPASVAPGGAITYTIRVRNNRPRALRGVTVTDDLRCLAMGARWAGRIRASTGTASYRRGTAEGHSAPDAPAIPRLDWHLDLAPAAVADLSYLVKVAGRPARGRLHNSIVVTGADSNCPDHRGSGTRGGAETDRGGRSIIRAVDACRIVTTIRRPIGSAGVIPPKATPGTASGTAPGTASPGAASRGAAPGTAAGAIPRGVMPGAVPAPALPVTPAPTALSIVDLPPVLAPASTPAQAAAVPASAKAVAVSHRSRTPIGVGVLAALISAGLLLFTGIAVLAGRLAGGVGLRSFGSRTAG